MKRTLLDRLGSFVLGKGFYIVLFLCVAAIGISGYFMVADPEQYPAPEAVAGNPVVTLPDESLPTQQQPIRVIPREEQAARPAVPSTPVEPPKEKVTAQVSAPVEGVREPAAFTWPVKGEVDRAFCVDALAYDRTMGDWRTHGGMDISAQEGQQVLCVRDGRVQSVEQDDLMGTTVAVDHGEGLVSVYANLSPETEIEVGQEVDTGAVLGAVGNTAIAEGAQPSHLHLEMTLNGEPVDPAEYLPGK